MNASRPRWLVWLWLASSLACFNSASYTPILMGVTGGPEALSSGVSTGMTTIFVSGLYLFPDTMVYRNGRPQRTTYLARPPPELVGRPFGAGAAALRVDLDAEATKVFGSFVLTAMGDGTLMSDPYVVHVVDAPFTLTGIAPRKIAAGSPATTIVMTGTGFNPSSQVFWNGDSLQTTFVSGTGVSAVVPAPLLAVAGDAIVQVREKSCGVLSCEAAAGSTLCTVGSAKDVLVVPSEASDVAWDATHSLLVAAMQLRPSGAFVLATIDPQTGGLQARVATDGPSGVSVSAGDQFMGQRGSQWASGVTSG